MESAIEKLLKASRQTKKPQALDWNHLTLEPFCGFISLTHTRVFDEQAEKSDCK